MVYTKQGLEIIDFEGGKFYKAPSAVVEDGAEVGGETTIWHNARVLKGAKVGSGCVLGAGVSIENGANIGNHVKIQSGGSPIFKGVKLEDYVFIGPSVVFTNDHNPRAFGDWELAETVVEIGASIGANSTIVAPVRVGALSLVGAGSVVTRDVRTGALVFGQPARVRGLVDVSGNVIRSVDEAYERDYMRLFLTSELQHLTNPRASIETLLRDKAKEVITIEG